MIRRFLILFFIFSSFNLSAYSIKITTTIYPISDVVHNIVPDAKIKTIIRDGQNPHLYAPSPNDIKIFNKTDVFIKIGFGFEKWFDKIIASIQNKRIVTIDLSKNIKPIMYDKKNKTANPHFWLSPYEVLQFLPVIKNKLIAYFPDKKNYIEKNYKKYRRKLLKLDKNLRMTLKKIKQKNILESHPLLDYFARDYGLNIAGTLKEKGNSTPSPRKIIKIMDAVKKYNIKYILTSETDTSIAKKIAAENNIKIATIDALGGKNKTYIKLIKYNTAKVLKSLK